MKITAKIIAFSAILFLLNSAFGINITFRVSVPTNTPNMDTVYIVGNHPQLGNWENPQTLAMTKVSDFVWERTFDLPAGTSLEYKYTRGSWYSVEKDAYENEIGNRTYIVPGSPSTVIDTVANWRIPHPYLSWVNDPKNTITISWWTPDTAGNSIVDYGLTVSLESTKSGPTITTYCGVELTGLIPNTTYYYRVRSNNGYLGVVNTFRTAPETVRPFMFVAFGDNRTNQTDHQNVVNRIIAIDPEFVLNTGDLVDSGTNSSNWETFFWIEKDLLKNRVMMPVVGNHEAPNDPACLYFNLFRLPGNESWYSFDYSNSHFIALSSETAISGAQLDWLKFDLALARQNPNIKWIFVFFHRPPYSSGTGHGSDLNIRNTWCPFFDTYNASIVFNGHDHGYERSKLIYNFAVSSSGVLYIVTGGGGAPLRPITGDWWTAYSISTFHSCRVLVSDTSVFLEAIRPDGVVFDNYTLLPPIVNAGPFYARGDFNGWSAVSKLTDPANTGVLSVTTTFANTGSYQVKIGNADWSLSYPYGSWSNVPFNITSPNVAVTFSLDTRMYYDGWLPFTNIVSVSTSGVQIVDQSNQWYLIGSVPELGSWDTTKAVAMTRSGSVWSYTTTIYTSSTVSWKCLAQKSWSPLQCGADGWGNNTQDVISVNIPVGEAVKFEYDPSKGRVRVIRAATEVKNWELLK